MITPIRTKCTNMVRKNELIELKKTCIWPTLWNQRIEISLHCCFTLSLELLNGLRSAVGMTQRIPPFGDKLRQGLILWPKLAASSNTVSENEGSSVSIVHLYCTWRQIHTTTKFQKNKVLHCFDLAAQHIANFQQVCIACSFINQCLKHQNTVTVRLTGIQI